MVLNFCRYWLFAHRKCTNMTTCRVSLTRCTSILIKGKWRAGMRGGGAHTFAYPLKFIPCPLRPSHATSNPAHPNWLGSSITIRQNHLNSQFLSFQLSSYQEHASVGQMHRRAMAARTVNRGKKLHSPLQQRQSPRQKVSLFLIGVYRKESQHYP